MNPWGGHYPAHFPVGAPSDHEALTRVMSPNQRFGVQHGTSSSTASTWLIRTCKCCGDVVTGPTVPCQACGQQVHGHCTVARAGHAVCTECANEMDFAFAHAQAARRFQQHGIGFGRLMSSSGQLAGQAIGSVASGTISGAAR